MLSNHDGADAHGERLARHVVDAVEETAVGLDGGLGQVNAVGALDEGVAGLVEADVAVVADAEELEVLVTGGGDGGVVLGAGGLVVLHEAVGHVGVGLVDVHVIEEVHVHEVAIALLVIAGQAAVLVEVVALDLREVQVAGLIGGNEVLVGADGRGAGGKTEHAVGLELDLGRDDVCGLAAHVVIVLGAKNPHDASLLSRRAPPPCGRPAAANVTATTRARPPKHYGRHRRVEAPARPRRPGTQAPDTP